MQFRDETLMDPDVEQFQTHLKEFTVSIYVVSINSSMWIKHTL
jgi:hypothetical protein